MAKQQAEARVDEADRLYDAGDYQAALDRLRQAQRLYPSPRLQFNFGLTFRSMGRDADAFDAFERFLAETRTDDAALAARRVEAARHVGELRGRVGLVDLVCDLDGVDVLVDGLLRGRAPGPHRVAVRGADAASEFADRIEVAAGERVRVQAHLSAAREPAPPPAPLYRRWWFWTAAGAAALAVTASAIVLGRGGWCDGCVARYPVSAR